MTDAITPHNLAVNLGEDTESQGLTEAEHIRQYLLANPDFFIQNSDLLEQLSIPHSGKGSVSLVEKQGEQLRQKIRQLTSKLNQLINVAKQNEKIYRVYVDLNLQLMKCKSINDVQVTLEAVMLEKLALSSVHLRPFIGPMALPELQQRLFVEKRFKKGHFFFGRLSQHERQLMFGDDIAESVALVLIGEDKPLGLLGVGSADAGHFSPNMDTLLLRQLQQMLTILLSELYQY